MQYLKKAFRSQQVNEGQDETVSETVTRILADVRARGMAAVRDYSRRFDNFDPPSFRLSRNELDAIGAEVPEAVKADLAFAQAQIRSRRPSDGPCATWSTSLIRASSLGTRTFRSKALPATSREVAIR
jgi:histidinol dehydrogenase